MIEKKNREKGKLRRKVRWRRVNEDEKEISRRNVSYPQDWTSTCVYQPSAVSVLYYAYKSFLLPLVQFFKHIGSEQLYSNSHHQICKLTKKIKTNSLLTNMLVCSQKLHWNY
ncbi:hypothetical protein OTU49_010956 [Cherax quadricarinatus]|uniref:Uncharacterized protein n=1 Tax=Cherax quadricarinatus TaxID=27406 RepID=A0AAW0W6F1_CHEQU